MGKHAYRKWIGKCEKPGCSGRLVAASTGPRGTFAWCARCHSTQLVIKPGKEGGER